MMTELSNSQDLLYAVAKEPTPVLNTQDFPSVFGGGNGVTVKTNSEGLIREMEFIALPGTVFSIFGEYDYGDHKILHVETDEYDYNSQLFIDSRFVELKKDKRNKIALYTSKEKNTLNNHCLIKHKKSNNIVH